MLRINVNSIHSETSIRSLLYLGRSGRRVILVTPQICCAILALVTTGRDHRNNRVIAVGLTSCLQYHKTFTKRVT
ncbi:hypothetical protein Agabi119p4_2425 [Agaricus bisporus var. burnettii]|uniref:Uncharacterized protein n=1 Tax=Agaricus bisporus var. burnettii TaxID=192524 RepID=A0A8H7F949_AGABI|nr:hypothetical protein Agabi119p4_2425 [Agaricus bisporus var. burnettii]